MLVSISVENYLSIREPLKIDFIADNIKEYKESQFSPLPGSKVNLLKSLAIFGSNGSGKSNLIKAIDFIRFFVLNSSKESQSNQSIPVQPFLLSSVAKHKPSSFEVVFYIEEKRYRYGFSVTQRYVESEWLFFSDKRKEEKLFVRAKQDYTFEKVFKAGLKGKFELFAEVTRPNVLFLSVLAQFNSPICLSISEWFSELMISKDNDHLNLIEYTASLMAISDYRSLINEIFRKTDLGIENIEEHLINSEKPKSSFYDFVMSVVKEGSMDYKVMTLHNEYDENSKVTNRVFFDLLKNESLGTQRFFGIIGPILESLKKRKILFIDELDAHLHTLLFDLVIKLYNSSKFNPNGAQIIFTAHNLHPLKKGLRRDQILFMEKDKIGNSSMSSLHAKYPEVRNDASFEKDYLIGRYNAIPKIGMQGNLFDPPIENE
ncbi:AAA family ATPase [Longitalea arenae]|uniref:AAA family ATPase n=1 Tax=Longitalea arenae TaxID=2812558 RepID=UPI001967A1F2|nr:ATP-binding protein [Longitalea arenae]